MKKRLNIRKIANASLAFLLSASHMVNAMEAVEKSSENTGLRDQVRVKVERVLRNFEENMNAYYKRTGNPKRISIAPASVPLEETAKVAVQQPKVQIISPEKEGAATGINDHNQELPPIETEQESQFKAKAAAEEATNKEFTTTRKDSLTTSLGLKPWSTDEEIKQALYLKHLLGKDLKLTEDLIRTLGQFGKQDPRFSRPTEAQFFVIKKLPYGNKQVGEVDALAQRYVKVKSRLLQKYPHEKLTPDQIFEGIRQQDNLKIADMSLEQINEGLRQRTMVPPKIANASLDEITEGLRLKQLGIRPLSKLKMKAPSYRFPQLS